jgi:hypothetical protein
MARNPEAVKAARRRWYYKNSARAKARVVERRKELRAWFQVHKRSLGLACRVCGEDEVVALDFHHRDPAQKEANVQTAIARGWGRERILKEISKCDVLCASCHRKFHAGLI